MTEAAPPPPPDPGAPARTPFRRFTNRLLALARTRWALPLLCATAFADASVLPAPPDLVLIAMTLGRPRRWLRYALCALAACLAGGVVGWVIGHYLWQAAGPWVFAHVPGITPAGFGKVEALYRHHALLPLIVGTVLGLPYLLFTLSAGVCGVPLPSLVLGMAVGRGARFLAVALLIRLYGERARRFLETWFKPFFLAAGLALALAVAVKLLRG